MTSDAALSSGVVLMGPLQTDIESTLGRTLAEEEMGSVGSFADFSDADREELRILAARSSVCAIAFIRYKLSGRTPLQDAMRYCDDVLRRGVSHEKWIADRGAKREET